MEAFLKKHFNKKAVFTTTSEAETINAAELFAEMILPGDAVALTGNLGAGKTHFVKGIAVYLGMKKKSVVSPTFNLLRHYKAKKMTVYHFDFYRLDNFDALDRIGYREYITDSGAIVVAEWPEKVRDTWKDFNWFVKIAHMGADKRKITVYKKR